MIKPAKYSTINFDSDEATIFSEKAFKEKKCLHDIYKEIYQKMMSLKNKYLTKENKILEIGSGGGFIKDIYPFIITSDIKKSNSDLIVNAEKLPFKDNSLDAIFALHCIHHIPNINNFFNEARRVIRGGGGIVCVEPYWSPIAKFLYKNMHPEPFNENADSWVLDEGKNTGPMTGSNQALSYLFLKRDYARFKELYPEFNIVYDHPFGFIRYIMTGGIWLKPKIPEIFFPFLKGLEFILEPIMPLIALHHVFVIKIQKHT